MRSSYFIVEGTRIHEAIEYFGFCGLAKRKQTKEATKICLSLVFQWLKLGYKIPKEESRFDLEDQIQEL